MKPLQYIVFGILIAVTLTSGYQSFAIVDNYQQATVSTTNPFTDMDLITDVDSDTVGSGGYLAVEGRGFLVTTAGNFKVVTHDSASAKTLTFPTGIIPLRVRQIYATGTTGVGYVGY